MRYLFMARSPKTGKPRMYEGLLELGPPGPYAIVSADQGEDEMYHPGDEGYQELLRSFNQVYPEER